MNKQEITTKTIKALNNTGLSVHCGLCGCELKTTKCPVCGVSANDYTPYIG